MKRPAEIVLIAAVARNGVIGSDNGLVFTDPVDQRHFRAATMGCPVVMGRRTWDSLPSRFRPLPGRRNVVVSRNPGLRADGAVVAPGLPQALALVADAPRVFVIGGAMLYAQALPIADTLLLTEIDADFTGDVRFPEWDRPAFDIATDTDAVASDGTRLRFVTYRRRPRQPSPD